ncbi:MAG: hypothetical protein MUQ10_17760 [Anaerolineae bacterium]|nr:hypothetical protein [Anaerolineae bacterium]
MSAAQRAEMMLQVAVFVIGVSRRRTVDGRVAEEPVVRPTGVGQQIPDGDGPAEPRWSGAARV